MKYLLLIPILLLTSCAEYQSHVAARTLSASGYSKGQEYGITLGDKVEYR